MMSKRNLRLMLGLCAAVLVCACSGRQRAVRTYLNVSGLTQGSTFSITYGDSLGRDFAPAIDSLLRLADSTMSVFNEHSVLSCINRNELDTLPPIVVQAIAQSMQLAVETEGAFDITIGPVTRAIGFAGGQSRGIDTAHVLSLMQHVGMDKIHLDGNRLLKQTPQVFIDLNGIAQGITVDMIADYFEQQGVRNYLVEVGGEVLASGQSGRGRPWVVGVDSPIEGAVPGQCLQAKMRLSRKRGLATSGNYRKVVEVDGQRYSHTVNPQTGLPVLNSLLSATVLAPTASRADALGTAFMVRGLEWSRAFVESTPDVDAILVYADSTGANAMWCSVGVDLVQ